MEDYEKQADELNTQARRLEATMLTYRALAECMKTGHDFHYNCVDENVISGMCNNCGIYIESKDVTMWFDDDNEEVYGDLAGKKLKDIEIETPAPSPETTETDEKPTVPLEHTEKEDGTYEVDVSEILGKKEGVL